MKKTSLMKRAMLTLGLVICSAMTFVSCVEEEIAPKSELTIGDVSVLDEGNGHNDNADGDRGNDNDDVIDIDVNL
jgi:hypothetical protein